MKELKLYLPKEDPERVTKQIEQITNKRNRQVNRYLHAASKGTPAHRSRWETWAGRFYIIPGGSRQLPPPGASSRWRLEKALID